MDRYTRVIQNILFRTERGEILWKLVRPHEFDEVLVNAPRVIRSFAADYHLGNRKDRLLFVERKGEQQDLFGSISESLEFELYVLNEQGAIVLELFDRVVDRADLSQLSGLIADQNDETRDFFDVFERASVT